MLPQTMNARFERECFKIMVKIVPAMYVVDRVSDVRGLLEVKDKPCSAWEGGGGAETLNVDYFSNIEANVTKLSDFS